MADGDAVLYRYLRERISAAASGRRAPNNRRRPAIGPAEGLHGLDGRPHGGQGVGDGRIQQRFQFDRRARRAAVAAVQGPGLLVAHGIRTRNASVQRFPILHGRHRRASAVPFLPSRRSFGAQSISAQRRQRTGPPSRSSAVPPSSTGTSPATVRARHSEPVPAQGSTLRGSA